MQPREQVSCCRRRLHARLAVLHELEHADEVLERGPLVAVREARIDVGHAALDRGLGAGLIDGRHESLLLSARAPSDHRDRRAGPGRVAAHAADRSRRSPFSPGRVGRVRGVRILARFRRERTVPTGHAERGRDLVVARAPPTRTAASASRSPSGSSVTASATRGHRSAASIAAATLIAGIVLRAPLGDEARRRRGSGALRCGGAWRRGSSRCRRATGARSRGRGRSVDRFSNAIRNTSPSSDSASSGPIRRTR